MEQKTYMCISYIPLLWTTDPGKDIGIKNAKKISEHLTKLSELGYVTGCAWTTEMEPVFILNRAKEIAEHLKAWSENKPEEWFDFVLEKVDKGYCAFLFPRVEKSIERFKQTWYIQNMEKIDEGNIKLLFSPLRFYSKKIGCYEHVRGKLSNSVRVGFIEKLEGEEPVFLGPFKIKSDMNIAKEFKPWK